MTYYQIIHWEDQPATLSDVGRLLLSFERHHVFDGDEIPRDTPIELWYKENRTFGIFAGDTSKMPSDGWTRAL